MMRTKVLLTTLGALVALVFSAVGLARSPLSADSANPGDYSAHVTNEWFPLAPSTTYVYKGVKDRNAVRDVMTVTRGTFTIAGVPCVVVEDRLYGKSGRVIERTTDWYTQDKMGNVWYFGEDTAEIGKNGRVLSTEGSWKAGVDGAKPGIFMPAHPKVGQSFRQEFYKGHAEDHFRVLSLLGSVFSPSMKNALWTQETTPLEPGVLDHKLYARGIGMVLEHTVKGGDEHLELVSVRRR
jgi:hypothetical protein